MNARQFGLAGLLAALALFANTGTAAAQGTVTWDLGYPIIHDCVPPPNPNPTPRSIDVLGSYTVNPGWTAQNASFNYTPAGGGATVPTGLQMLNGKVGALQNGQIVAANISGNPPGTMPPGTYTVEIAILYTNPNANPPQVVVRTGAFNITIK